MLLTAHCPSAHAKSTESHAENVIKSTQSRNSELFGCDQMVGGNGDAVIACWWTAISLEVTCFVATKWWGDWGRCHVDGQPFLLVGEDVGLGSPTLTH